MRKITFFLVLTAWPLAAQWLHYPDPKVPRTKDGKPNLAAPAPRTADGKPDFSGMWAAPDGTHLANLAAGGVKVEMLPWAEQIYRTRQEEFGKGSPFSTCLPHSATEFDSHFTPKKWIQLPGQMVLLFEAGHTFREIFTDGRPLPPERDPAWFGYSTGKWDRNTLVVDTVGFNPKTWLDDGGHPHSDALHLIERFQRPDFGHMQVEITIDDPKAYAKPWTVKIPWNYVPDTELLDWVCENNKDPEHMVGK